MLFLASYLAAVDGREPFVLEVVVIASVVLVSSEIELFDVLRPVSLPIEWHPWHRFVVFFS